MTRPVASKVFGFRFFSALWRVVMAGSSVNWNSRHNRLMCDMLCSCLSISWSRFCRSFSKFSSEPHFSMDLWRKKLKLERNTFKNKKKLYILETWPRELFLKLQISIYGSRGIKALYISYFRLITPDINNFGLSSCIFEFSTFFEN